MRTHTGNRCGRSPGRITGAPIEPTDLRRSVTIDPVRDRHAISYDERAEMNPGRRLLRFESLDDIMPDVERLLEGHRTVGNWSLAQICRHLATVMRRVVDLPASTPHDPSQRVSAERKREVFDSGMLPEGLQGPAEVMPAEYLGPREEAENLRDAIAHYKASPGPVIGAPVVWPAHESRVGPAAAHPHRPPSQLCGTGNGVRKRRGDGVASCPPCPVGYSDCGGPPGFG